jgi:hypothetical protein
VGEGLLAKISDITLDAFARQWFVLPAMFWLAVVTVSGSWIRYIWAFPSDSIIDPKHLTHAHSHVALLGWCWAVVVAYLLRNVVKPKRSIHWWKLYAVMFHVSVGGMFVTFSMDGYWKWSIIFSAMHVLLGTGFAVVYYVSRAKMATRPSLTAFDASILLMLIANVGPVLLSMGSMQTASFVTIAVNGYVHLHCFGFLVLFMLGMLFDKILVAQRDEEVASQSKLIYLLAFSVIPAQLIAVSHLIDGNVDLIVGSIGMALYATGLAAVVYTTFKNWSRIVESGCGSMLRVVMVAVACLAFALLLASVPSISSTFRDARFLVIGIIHLLLLGIVTPAFLYYSHRCVGLGEHDVKRTVVLLVLSIWVMISVLVMAGIGQGLSLILPFHVPLVLFFSAIPVSIAAIVLFIKAVFRSSKSAI